MKILFVSAVLPWPLHSGGQVRIYNLLKRLSKKHEITLVSFIRDENERKFAENLSFCKHVHVVYRGKARQVRYFLRAITSAYPWLLSTYENAKMRQLLNELISRNQYDLFHIEPFYVFPSLPEFSIPIVVGEHNVEYRIYEGYVRAFPLVPLRPLLFLDIIKLRLWEERVWKKAVAITAVSEEDRSVIERKTNVPVTVVANGVDLASFPFRPSRSRGVDPILLFVGNFSWLPNVEGCTRLLNDIWPFLKERFPSVTLRIVGRNMPQSLKRRANARGATVVGEVRDIAKEYQTTDALMAPVGIGGGTKFKMLEAMASGLPVITTRAGMQGLEAIAGVHYLQASTPEEFGAQTEKIWEDISLRSMITKSARKLVEERYSWDSIAKILDDVWNRTYEEHH